MPTTTPWSRRLALAVPVLSLILGLSLPMARADQPVVDGETIIPVMFVQNAAAASYSDGLLTLQQVHPEVLWFSNRPYRMAGTSPLQKYLNDWNEGGDSFKSDPPNATLSFLTAGDKGEAMSSAAMELSEPTVSGDAISYRVKLLEGEPPTETGPVSLFIDFVGMVWRRPVVVDRPLVVRRPVVVTRPFVVRPPAAVVVKPAPIVVTAPSTVVVKKQPPTTVVVTKDPPATVKVVPASATETKLSQLKLMYDQGLITRSEYRKKQQELLKQF